MSKQIYVYIAGPISQGDTLVNIRRAIDLAEDLLGYGLIPFCPHAMTSMWHIVHPHSYNKWLEYDFAWIAQCDALLRIEGPSDGSDLEVDTASHLGIPVFEGPKGFARLIKWARYQQSM